MTVQVMLASLNGLRSLKKAEIQAMMIRDPGGRQQAEMIFLRRLCEFVQIGDKQYVKFLWRLAYIKGTCQATLTENLNTWRLSAKFVPRVLNIEQNTACLSPLISFERYERLRTAWKSSSQVKRYGFTDTIRNETSFFAVEVARVSKTEDSVSGAFQSDSHDDFIFWHGRGCSLRMSPKVNQWINVTTEVLKRLRMNVCRKRPNKWESRAWVLHHDNAPTHTAQSVQVFFSKPWHSCGSSTTIPPSWIRVISGCFPNLKWHQKEKE